MSAYEKISVKANNMPVRKQGREYSIDTVGLIALYHKNDVAPVLHSTLLAGGQCRCKGLYYRYLLWCGLEPRWVWPRVCNKVSQTRYDGY